MCPAGKCDCETLDWQPVCNGVTIMPTDKECIRPSRQQPTVTEQVAAEIADMPIEEFQANCEKLKGLSPDPRTVNLPADYATGYFNGASEQSKRDIEAVKNVMIKYTKAKTAKQWGKRHKDYEEFLIALEKAKIQDEI